MFPSSGLGTAVHVSWVAHSRNTAELPGGGSKPIVLVFFTLGLVHRVVAEQRLALSPNLWSKHVNRSFTFGFPPQIGCTNSNRWVCKCKRSTLVVQEASEELGCEARFMGGTALGVLLTYFIILPSMRLTEVTAMVVVACNSVAFLVAVTMIGALNYTGLQVAIRSLLFLMAAGSTSVFLCRVRSCNAFAKFVARRRIAVMAERRANFLRCLMLLKVFRSRMSAPVQILKSI